MSYGAKYDAKRFSKLPIFAIEGPYANSFLLALRFDCKETLTFYIQYNCPTVSFLVFNVYYLTYCAHINDFTYFY